jgi:hypothetical protein
MIKRVFWLGLGIAVGVIIVRKVGQVVESYSPAGLAGSAKNSAAGALDSVRDFVADVRMGMAEREDLIHAAIQQGVSIEDVLAEADEADEFDFLDDTPGRGGYRRG